MQKSPLTSPVGHIEPMLRSHPAKPNVENRALVECIEACADCAQACILCADACLAQDHVDMLVRCIRLNQDCATICSATGEVLSRQTAFEEQTARAMLEACRGACRLCAEECMMHASRHEHCRICADACRHCEQACAAVLPS